MKINDVIVGTKFCYVTKQGEKSFGKVNRIENNEYRVVWFRDESFKDQDYIGKYGTKTIAIWLSDGYFLPC